MINIEYIKKRKEKLENARVELKKHFVCLDDIIDKLIDSISLWYIDSSILERSPIINLWGATGTGKTDLIKRLVNLLELDDQFFHVSMHGLDLEKEDCSMNDDSLKSFQKLLLIKTDYTKNNNVIFLDEFQWFNTLDQDGNVMHDMLNDIWDFFSEREIKQDLIRKEFDQIVKTIEMYKEFGHTYCDSYESNDNFIYEIEGEPKNKKRKKKTRRWDDLFEEPVSSNRPPIKYIGQILSLSQLRFLNKYLLDNKYKTYKELGSILVSDFIKIFEEKINKKEAWKNISCKSYLIIVSGNLDEAYNFCQDVSNYDIDADYYHQLSKKINITDIKSSLKNLYRDEHISRLGNNHLIFPLIDCKGYKQIISRYFNDQLDSIKNKHGVKINIDGSIVDVIYNNSVYPVQGTRPVFTTINDFFNSIISNFVLESLVRGIQEISISYDNYMVKCIGNNFEFSSKYIGDIDKIKINENNKNNEKIVYAVHEAGHCIVHSVLNKVVPNKIVVSTNNHYGGFVFTSEDKISLSQFEKHIMVCFAGIEAEKVIFNSNISTGSASDIDKATKFMSFLVRKSGIFANNKIVNNETRESDQYNTDIDSTNKDIEKMSKNYRDKTKKILIENKKILVELADELYKRNILNGEEIKQFFLDRGMEFSNMGYNTEYIIEDLNNEFINRFEQVKLEVKEK